ncbi:MAG: hypothetical protein P1V35_09230, partial [Planctomycetota bacterium]|nr:hypothetical protein [Planctomycetota bacterium]
MHTIDRTHGVYPAMAVESSRVEIPLGERVSDGFDWQEKGPLDLLEKLKQGYVEGVQFPCFTVWGVHRGWIRESDIPGLFELADSTDPCLAVVMSTCSFLPMEPSTVGQEALSMVLAFMEE